MPGGHDEKASRLIGPVAIGVYNVRRNEQEVAATRLDPYSIAKDVDGAFENVEAFGHVLVQVRWCAGEVGRDAELDERRAGACVVEGGVNIDRGAQKAK